MAYFPAKFRGFPEALAGNGYFVGTTGKGWGPGVANDADGKPRAICGKPFEKRKAAPPAAAISNNDYAANFADFLDAAPRGTAVVLLVRGHRTPPRLRAGFRRDQGRQAARGHRPGARVLAGQRDRPRRHARLRLRGRARRPAPRPDARRAGAARPAGQHARHRHLRPRGAVPAPRARRTRLRTASRSPCAGPGASVRPGRAIDDFVDFTDVAPTLLDVAGLDWADGGMAPAAGRSWREIFESERAGRVVAGRDHVLVGKERHDVGRPHDGDIRSGAS